MNENLTQRWMKPVAVLFWLLTAGVVLSSIGLLVARPWYLRHMAIAELKRHGDFEISEDGETVAFSLNDQYPDRETVADLAVLLERVCCTDLDLRGYVNLKDINGLEKVESLRTLYLADTGVSDVGPLAALTNLQRLYLSGTGVSDVGPLAALTNLQWLDLNGTGVSDVGPLAALTNLQWLYLNGTRVSDVGPLAALTNLLALILTGTKVLDEQVDALRKKLPKCYIYQ